MDPVCDGVQKYIFHFFICLLDREQFIYVEGASFGFLLTDMAQVNRLVSFYSWMDIEASSGKVEIR